MIQADENDVRRRFNTLVELFHTQFLKGLDEKYKNSIFLSEELLHCAVSAYFDDILRYEEYAGSECADRHKLAAYTIKWISRFRPIQLKETAQTDSVLLTINEAFALFAGFMFLDPSVLRNISKKFYKHLIYSIIYRNLTGKGLATIMYLIETGTAGGVKF